MGRDFALKNNQVIEAEALYAQGLPMSRVAEIFGVAHDCVKRALIARGVNIRNQAEQARFFPMTLERLKLNAIITPSGCWLWSGKQTPTGYCRITVAGAQHYVHRLAYELATGSKPKANIDIRQDCGNRHCFNPECLIASTRKTTVAHARLSRGILHSLAVKRGHARNGYQPALKRHMRVA
jgi:hypothetical protein